MRVQYFLAFAAAATLSVSAFADPSIAPSVAPNTVTVQAPATSYHRLMPVDAAHMQGTYQLTDGRQMRVTNRFNRLFIDLDGKHEELLPSGQNSFVSNQTHARVTFNQVPFADEVTVDQAAR
jgi:hypothetical protein